MARKRQMKMYLVTYHQPASAWKKMEKMSEEEGLAAMGAWMKWAKKCGQNLKDMGAPLTPGQRLNGEGKASPSKRKISGYSILQATSLTEAKKMLKNHPHLSWGKGCEIEVHEAIDMVG